MISKCFPDIVVSSTFHSGEGKVKKGKYEIGEICTLYSRCKGETHRGRKVERGGEKVGERDSIEEKSTLFKKSFLPNGSDKKFHYLARTCL